jgi:beta-glucosidase
VPTWLTLNEPKTVVNVGYRYGAHAPGKRDEDAADVACHHLLLAHGLAVQAYRAAFGKGRIGPGAEPRPGLSADDSEARSRRPSTPTVWRTGSTSIRSCAARIRRTC